MARLDRNGRGSLAEEIHRTQQGVQMCNSLNNLGCRLVLSIEVSIYSNQPGISSR